MAGMAEDMMQMVGEMDDEMRRPRPHIKDIFHEAAEFCRVGGHRQILPGCQKQAKTGMTIARTGQDSQKIALHKHSGTKKLILRLSE